MYISRSLLPQCSSFSNLQFADCKQLLSVFKLENLFKNELVTENFWRLFSTAMQNYADRCKNKFSLNYFDY